MTMIDDEYKYSVNGDDGSNDNVDGSYDNIDDSYNCDDYHDYNE